MYDLVTLGKKGANWLAHLPEYNRILNDEWKEELGWRSPFEIYCGRKSHALTKTSMDSVNSHDEYILIRPPKEKDFARHCKNVHKVRKVAKRSNKKMNDRMIKRYKPLNKAERYQVYQDVLLRYKPQKCGSLAQKKRFIVKGTEVKKSSKSEMYKT